MRRSPDDLKGTYLALYGVGLGGLEPPTSSLSGKRSNRLSHRPRRYQLGRRIRHGGLRYRKPGRLAQSVSFSVTSMPPERLVTRLYSAAPIVARAVNRIALMAPMSAV
jgi:hypothetical protein